MLSFLLQRFLLAKRPRNRRRRPTLSLTSERMRDWSLPSASVTSGVGPKFESASACFGHELMPTEHLERSSYFVVDDGIRDRESWSTTWSECDAPLIDNLDFERFTTAARLSNTTDDMASGASDEKVMRYLDELNQRIVEALNGSFATGAA
jgi:hypothetical protein